jgi:CRISPR-associated protein Csx10
MLSASGESTALIDADVKYDQYGFPFIQAKTFKGLLHESCLEVCEMFHKNYDVVDELFGKTGQKSSGTLSFNNLLVMGYDAIQHELNANPKTLRPESAKDHFTEVRQQTSIEDGVAKDKSLRKYRLVKEGVKFETTIENVPSEHEAFLKNALLNLRYIGTRRNRGFGKISITVTNYNPTTASGNQKGKEQSSEVASVSSSEPKNWDNNPLSMLSFDIETLDTLLIAKVFGDQNTVTTEEYIPAQNIRGLIAGLIIRDKNLTNNAHYNETFNDIILSGKAKFSNAFLKGVAPVPRIYGYDKTDNNSKAVFLFGKDKPLKNMQGFAELANRCIVTKSVETTFSFHNSRSDNRLAGRSTKEDGAIFYYEGIAPGQTFSTGIISDKYTLEYIKSLLEMSDGIHRIGKSKSAQYSRVKFNNFKITEVKHDKDNPAIPAPIYIVFQSPVITQNEYGMAIPDLKILQTELASYINGITKISIASTREMVESYMGVWQSKTPREAAFDIATTLRVEFSGKLKQTSITKLELVGLGERKAEGYGQVKVMSLEENLERKSETNSPITTNGNVASSNPFTNQTLKEIFDKQARKEQADNIKSIAIDKAKAKRGKLPNSIISKLKEKLLQSNNERDWMRYIDDMKGKKAYKTLDNTNLWNDISTLNAPDAATFEDKKMYWLEYFNALRVKQIKTK